MISPDVVVHTLTSINPNVIGSIIVNGVDVSAKAAPASREIPPFFDTLPLWILLLFAARNRRSRRNRRF